MFDRNQIVTDKDQETEGAGITLRDIGRALMIWTSMQEKRPCVGYAAATFNTTPDIIRDAVNEDSWAFLTPVDEKDSDLQYIDVDGE
jgi:hypothetical protein